METKTANKAKQGDRGIHPKEKNKDKSPEEELNTIEISNLPEKTVFFVQSLNCVQLCLDPMDYSMPGFLLLLYVTEFAQTLIHWVSDAIQPSHPGSLFSSRPQFFPISGSFPMSQLFASGSQSIGASSS